MNKLRPGTKIILVFILSFFSTYVITHFVVAHIKMREQLVHKEAARIIQDEISERFDLVLDITLVIGQMSSAYFYETNKKEKGSREVIDRVLEGKEYIIGINQLNPQGKIINIYPKEDNQKAHGKVTQNYEELLKSYNRGEQYWFSPPFHLFQGGSGFVFYIPITENRKLIGWMAPVISSELFFKHFRSMDLFNEYDLIIKDGLTGKTYFETAFPPASQQIEEVRSRMHERDIIFQSWPKISAPKFEISFGWRFLICFLSAFFCSVMMKIYLQKKKAYSRLENISDLLKLTSNEALTKLMDIQTEYLSIGSNGFLSTSVVEKDVQSVTNLIEQIDLLQNIAETEQLDEEEFEVLPLLDEHLAVLRDVIGKKDLHLELDAESFKEVTIVGNKWLVSNTVLKNALSYSALISRPSGKIEIFHSRSNRECSTTFHISKVYEEDVYKAFNERRLLVARSVMDLLNGKITIQKDGEGGMFLKLTTEVS